MTRRSKYALLLAPVILATGCGTQTQVAGTSAEPAVRQGLARGIDLSMVRYVHADYQSYDSPEKLAANSELVAAGEVAGFQQGPKFAPNPRIALEHHVVMRIRVTTAIKGAKRSKAVSGGTAFLDFFQGPTIVDKNKPPRQWKVEKSVADWENAIPRGTKVMLFGQPEGVSPHKLVSQGDARPAGAPLLTFHPQGLIFEGLNRSLAGPKTTGSASTLIGGAEDLMPGAWQEPKTMAELVDRLRKKGFAE